MIEAVCQCCGRNDVLMWEICGDCGWKNSTHLEFRYNNGDVEIIPVGFRLHADQRALWSYSNAITPDAHYSQWEQSGKIPFAR
jgi:hypothetical protein